MKKTAAGLMAISMVVAAAAWASSSMKPSTKRAIRGELSDARDHMCEVREAVADVGGDVGQMAKHISHNM